MTEIFADEWMDMIGTCPDCIMGDWKFVYILHLKVCSGITVDTFTF